MPKLDTVIVSKATGSPLTCICVNQTDTDVEPNTTVDTNVDYDSLTPEDKALFDQTVAMILTYIPS